MSEEIKKTEPLISPEQAAVASLTAAAETVFSERGVGFEPSGLREGEMARYADSDANAALAQGGTLCERKPANSEKSEFTWFTVYPGRLERLYGKWEKGGAEVTADSEDGPGKKGSLGLEGIEHLELMLKLNFQTSQPKPEEPEQPKPTNPLKKYVASLAMRRQRKQTTRAVMNEIKQNRKNHSGN